MISTPTPLAGCDCYLDEDDSTCDISTPTPLAGCDRNS